MDHAPVTSVVVEYFLPVSVFCAVTVTPGSGMLPLLTAPCKRPPAMAWTGGASTLGAEAGTGEDALDGDV